MVSYYLATLLAVSGVGDTVLVDFRADYCSPCREMDPVVAQLASRGFSVQRCDVDKDPTTASRFKIGKIPCFVLLVDGQEVDRVVGKTDIDRLEGMFRRAEKLAKMPKNNTPNTLLKMSGNAGSLASNSAKAAPTTGELANRLIAATVRIRIGDTGGNSVGTGTIIDARQGQALVLTCGHVFRDSQGKGKISVDLFGAAPQTVEGKLLAFDDKRDTGLLSIPVSGEVAVAPVAQPGYQLKKDDKVISVGCNHGDNPTAIGSAITSVNRYKGPANVQVAGMPVQGRSGGGLFNLQGQVIGVCNAADEIDKEGLYAAIDTVHAQLDSAKLTWVYRPNSSAPLLAVKQPQEMPIRKSFDETDFRPRPAPEARDNGLSRQEQGALQEIGKYKGAEIVVIVRPKGDPNGRSEVFQIDSTAPSVFLKELSAQQRPADAGRAPANAAATMADRPSSSGGFQR